MPPARPAVSVVLVSDYAAGAAKSWEDLRGTLTALAGQDFSEPAEFILSENAQYVRAIPEDLIALLPSLRIVSSPHEGSYALKNHGIAQASAEIAVIKGLGHGGKVLYESEPLATFMLAP
jgi:hypothetical protein